MVSRELNAGARFDKVRPGYAGELMDLTITAAKAAARALREDMADSGVNITHSRALELVSHQLGYHDWNTAAADLDNRRDTGMGGPVPVLRIQDENRAREFYLDYLGFVVEWEHRFEPGMPLYIRLRRAQAVIDPVRASRRRDPRLRGLGPHRQRCCFSPRTRRQELHATPPRN